MSVIYITSNCWIIFAEYLIMYADFFLRLLLQVLVCLHILILNRRVENARSVLFGCDVYLMFKTSTMKHKVSTDLVVFMMALVWQ